MVQRVALLPRSALRWRDGVPRAEGVWRDDDQGGALIRDQPIIIHCYVAEADFASSEDADKLADLGAFCRRMGREAKQGEIGLVIANEYYAFRDFDEGE